MGPQHTRAYRGRAAVVGCGEIFAAGLAFVLAERGWTVVQRCCEVEEVDLTAEPQVVLLDLAREAGAVDATLDACRSLTKPPAATRVMAITDVVEPDLFDRAMRAGLSGLQPRDLPVCELDRAAQAVLIGQTAFDRTFAVRALRAQAADEAPSTMSERDLVLVRHLAEGRSTDDIARLLGRSPSTVKLRVGDLKRRFGAENRAGLVYMAIKQGLI